MLRAHGLVLKWHRGDSIQKFSGFADDSRSVGRVLGAAPHPDIAIGTGPLSRMLAWFFTVGQNTGQVNESH
jgi:hypothetical protein